MFIYAQIRSSHFFIDKAYCELGHDGLSFKNNWSPEAKFGKHCSRILQELRRVSWSCLKDCRVLQHLWSFHIDLMSRFSLDFRESKPRFLSTNSFSTMAEITPTTSLYLLWKYQRRPRTRRSL